jgi:hypothetical protein
VTELQKSLEVTIASLLTRATDYHRPHPGSHSESILATWILNQYASENDCGTKRGTDVRITASSSLARYMLPQSIATQFNHTCEGVYQVSRLPCSVAAIYCELQHGLVSLASLTTWCKARRVMESMLRPETLDSEGHQEALG